MSTADEFDVVVSPEPGLDELIEQLEINSESLGQVIDNLANLLSGPEFDSNPSVQERLAALARGIAENYEKNTQRLHYTQAYALATAWKCRAARLGDLTSLFDLARREANTSLRTAKPTDGPDWLAAAFDAVLEAFGRIRNNSEKESKAKQLLDMSKDIIRWKNGQSSTEAADWLARLIKALAQEFLFDIVKDELRSLREEVTSATPGIWVLDGVTPSSDRVVKSTLEMYKALCEMPTPLAGVPDVTAMKKALDREFPWFAEITAWVLNHLAVRSAGTLGFKIPSLLLLGAPGVGKTRYFQRLAQISGLPFLCLSLAGKNDNRDFAGTARGWGTGHPSRVIALINEHRIANPIVLLDEIDKAGGSDHNGRITDTLLTLLEPESSRRVYDDYLWGHANLSRVSWIATANSTHSVPSALLSRLEVKTVGNPKKPHYPAIVRRTIADYLEREGLAEGWVTGLTAAEWQWLSGYYQSPRLARRATEMLVNHKLTRCASGSA